MSWKKYFQKAALGVALLVSVGAHAEIGEPEKEDLTFGFIKLTDMAPIAIAYENGYFEDEGLYVKIEAQAHELLYPKKKPMKREVAGQGQMKIHHA